MKRPLAMVVAAAAVAAAALPGAAAAPASTTFKVVGIELAAGASQGTFVGKATGSADKGVWTAVVQHSSLGSLPAAVTGGTLKLGSLSSSAQTDFVVGRFTGGSISPIALGPNCANQKFAVSGNLGGVRTKTSSGGTGLFRVVLTHYRTSVLGRCFTYFATVAGTASFTY